MVNKAPDPSTVRPLRILKQTLEFLKTKWVEDQNYTYICDQFKSLRQDLTVSLQFCDMTFLFIVLTIFNLKCLQGSTHTK